MAELRHLTGDRWEVRLYAGRHPATGRSLKRSRSFRATGPQDAKRKAGKVEAALRAELAEEAKQAGTVADLTRRWLKGPKAAGWSPTTRRGYERIARRIVADLGRLRADKVRPVDVDDWLQKVAADGVSPRTVAHHRAVLRAIFRQGERWGLLESSRATTLSTPPRVGKAPVSAPPLEVVQLLLASAKPRLRAAAAVAVYAGLRRGEVCGLRWDDLDGDRLTVRRNVVHDGRALVVKGTKSGRERTVVLPSALMAELVRVMAANAEQAGRLSNLPRDDSAVSGYVFPDLLADPTGQTPRRPDWLTLAWRRHAKRHGAKVRFHDLRHFHATLLLQLGVPVQDVAARLGHAEVSTTLNNYSHPDEAQDRMAADKLGGMLALPEGDTR